MLAVDGDVAELSYCEHNCRKFSKNAHYTRKTLRTIVRLATERCGKTRDDFTS